MKYIITYQDAQEICKLYNNFNFSEHLYRIDGYKISTFDYFICGYDHFAKPLPDRSDVNAFDMRGVTFVFNEDGTIWNKFLMLPKFFNLNQVASTQYDVVKNKEIVHVSSKEDGSLVAFMMLPNGNLFAKTIRGFSNDQTAGAMQILYVWGEKVEWVKSMLRDGFTPMFEYVSYDNRIVLKYGKADLILIGLRNNNNGDFIPASEVVNLPSTIIPAKKEIFTLDELIEKSKVEENKEGWVVMFPDLMIKIKTAWYFKVHGLRTENCFREDYVISNYYSETLDDILSQFNTEDDADAIKFINTVTHAIDNYSGHIDTKVALLQERLKTEFDNNWSTFATKCHKEPYFEFVKFFDDKDEYKKRKINFILRKAYRLNDAKEIVEKYKSKI
jgi:T4 RnlA family RNA ligase